MEYLVESDAVCPFCWESFPLTIDTSAGDYETVDDCPVCCRPMTVRVRARPGQVDSIETTP